MTSPRSRRRRAQASVNQRLGQPGQGEFPTSVISHRHGRVVARIIREADYQEVTTLAAEHLRHLADEAEHDAIPLEDMRAWLDVRREERRLARWNGE